MVLPGSINDREHQKFVDTVDGPAVRTTATITAASGIATEATLIQVRDNLADIEGYVDGLEALGTAGNALATSILDAVDGLEAYTDGIESLLTTIRDNADQLEGYTDGIEGLIASTNALLTTIRDNADQLEGYLDGVEALLTSIRDGEYADTATPSSVTAATSSTEIIAADAATKGFILYNDANRSVRVAYAATASAASFTFVLAAGATHRETHTVYRGVVSGIWDAGIAAGSAMRVTKLT